MTNCGIIAEYNPFHNGHLLQLNKAKEISDNVIVVMSGNFVQRGEPAICDKFSRTKTALLNGADIVIELPVCFSTSTAELFAFASVSLLHMSCIADYLCFGCETDDIHKLTKAAESILELNRNNEFKTRIKNELRKGVSFPTARSAAMDMFGADTSVLHDPNNILAVEYIKALSILKSHITPIVVKRVGASHNSDNIEGTIASATAIRRLILDAGENSGGDYKKIMESVMPKESLEILRNEIAAGNAPNCLDNYSDILQYILRLNGSECLRGIMDVGEGLENRIIAMAGKYHNISEIISHVKTKRYAYTRLQRIVLHVLLGISEKRQKYYIERGGPQYIRVLGFKREKSRLLKDLSKAKIPVIINLKNSDKILNPDALGMLRHEILATDIYNLTLKNHRKAGYEYTVPICVI